MKLVNVKTLRRRLGLTQSELGKILGVHWTTISHWESGRQKRSPLHETVLQKLKEYEQLGIGSRGLLGIADDKGLLGVLHELF